MLTENERRFMDFWETHRDREKRFFRQLLIGIPVGLLFTIPILLLLFSGKLWYKRADAVANTQTSPVVLVVAAVIIIAFVSIFYKRQQWEMKEQQYQELKNKETKQSKLKEEKQQ